MAPSDCTAELPATVFVYGTLREPAQADALLADWRYLGDAVLRGLHRVEGTYPTLAPGGSVEGRLLETDEVGRLDEYEGVDRGLYVRVEVPFAGYDSREAATVYVGDPDPLDARASWPGDGPFVERVRRFVDENDVVVGPVD